MKIERVCRTLPFNVFWTLFIDESKFKSLIFSRSKKKIVKFRWNSRRIQLKQKVDTEYNFPVHVAVYRTCGQFDMGGCGCDVCVTIWFRFYLYIESHNKHKIAVTLAVKVSVYNTSQPLNSRWLILKEHVCAMVRRLSHRLRLDLLLPRFSLALSVYSDNTNTSSFIVSHTAIGNP